MNKIEIAYKEQGYDLVLDYLDKALNSNSFLLEFETPEEEYELETFLLGYLRTGMFHHELVKQDISRDWYNYSDQFFSKDYKSMYVLPYPGNTWNGKEQITYQEISKNDLQELLNNMLSGKLEHPMVAEQRELLDESDRKCLISLFFASLDNAYQDWSVYSLKPDFLYSVEERAAYDFSDSSNVIPIGYFEGFQKDYAILFKMNGFIYLLLTNGY